MGTAVASTVFFRHDPTKEPSGASEALHLLLRSQRNHPADPGDRNLHRGAVVSFAWTLSTPFRSSWPLSTARCCSSSLKQNAGRLFVPRQRQRALGPHGVG